jgi:hypothetical protein
MSALITIQLGALVGKSQDGKVAALTSFHTTELLICALGDVAIRYDRWDVAASLVVSVSSRHSSHGSDLALADRGRGS